MHIHLRNKEPVEQEIVIYLSLTAAYNLHRNLCQHNINVSGTWENDSMRLISQGIYNALPNESQP